MLVHPLEHLLQGLARQLAFHHALIDGNGAAVVAIIFLFYCFLVAKLRKVSDIIIFFVEKVQKYFGRPLLHRQRRPPESFIYLYLSARPPHDGTFLSGFDRYWKKAGDLFCLSAFGFADYEKLKAYLAEKYNDDEKAWQKIVKEMKDNGLSPSVDESEGGPDYMTNMI